MNEDNEFIYCQNCGSKMRKVQRCCLKCGALNYLNEENDSMETFQEKADKEVERKKKDYKFVSSEDAPDRVIYAKHAGSRTLCLLINIFWYIGPIVAFFIIQPVPIDKELILDYRYSLLFLLYTYEWFLTLGLQLLYMKCDKRWWSALVPFYSTYNWFEITMNSGWSMFILLIPGVGQIYALISLWNLGERFGKNKLLCVLIPFIMVPIISYNDDCLYDGVTYAFSKESDEKALLNNYKINSGLSRYMIFVVVICALINGYYWGREYIKYKYVRDVTIILDKTEDAQLVCENSVDPNGLGEYYIKYYDAAEELGVELPSKYDAFYKRYTGYIKVVREDGKTKKYINMTNGYYGVRNEQLYNISKEDIEYGTKLTFNIPKNKVKCTIR